MIISVSYSPLRHVTRSLAPSLDALSAPAASKLGVLFPDMGLLSG